MLPIFLLLSLLPFSTAGQCPSGYSLYASLSKCFKAYDIPSTYFAAQFTCGNDGGYLATVSNGFANSFIGSLMTTSSYYYIGLNKLMASDWTWVDGTSVGYTNWAPGQSSDKPCAGTMGGVNTWGTLVCDSPLPFICMTNLKTDNGSQVCPSQLPATIPILSTKPPTTCPPIPAQCPDGWLHFPLTNSCYLTVKRSVVWDDAADYCHGINSTLVSIHSDEENRFVANLSSTGMPLDWPQQVWIGLFRANGKWKWIDGTAYDWPPPWFPGSPWNPPLDFAYIFADDYYKNPGHQYQWDNWDAANTMRAFVCKMALR